MEPNHIPFRFDLDLASPSNLPAADDFITLLAIPSPNKFDTSRLSPLDIAKLGPFRSPDLVSPITLFSESEDKVSVTPILGTIEPAAVDSCPISYELYSPFHNRYTEDSDACSRSATPCSMHLVSEPSSPRSSRSPSQTPSSVSRFSPYNSRTVTPEINPPRPSKPKGAVTLKPHTPASVGRCSNVSISSSRSWSETENRACMNLMRQVCSQSKFQGKESRFAEVSRRMLKEYGFNRPNVKNQWNRYLRARCGFEDRGEKKRGGGIVTSALSGKRKRVAVVEDENVVDEENELGAADADDEDNVGDDKQDLMSPTSTTTNRTSWRPLGGKSFGGKSVPGYVPSSSHGGKSYTGQPFPRKTLPAKPVTRLAPRKTINTKSLSINTGSHNYTGGKTIWPSTEKEADHVVVSDSEPCSPSSPSMPMSDDKEDEDNYTKGSTAEVLDVNDSVLEGTNEHDLVSHLPYLSRRLKRTRVISDNSDSHSDGSEAEHNSSASAPKKRSIGDRDAAMAAELQRAWGLGLRRRG